MAYIQIKNIAAAVAAIVWAASAIAAEGDTDFSGPYIGAKVGVDRSSTEGGFPQGVSVDKTKNKPSIGIEGGYNWKADDLLIGVLGSYSYNQKKCHGVTGSTAFTEFCYGSNILGLGAKLGYQLGDALPYLKGGYNRIKLTGDTTESVNAPFYGLGLEYRLGGATTVALDWTSTKHDESGAFGTNTIKEQMLTVGLNYYFDTPKTAPAPAPVAAEPAPAPEPVVEAAPAPVPEPVPAEPVSPVEQALAENRVVTLEGVHFTFKSAELRSTAARTLDDVVKFANSHQDAKFEVSGHTDDVGKNWKLSKNQQLSEQRAASVKAYLVSKGVAADRITTAGYSYTRPVADNSTEAGRAQNRRVEIRANYAATN